MARWPHRAPPAPRHARWTPLVHLSFAGSPQEAKRWRRSQQPCGAAPGAQWRLPRRLPGFHPWQRRGTLAHRGWLRRRVPARPRVVWARRRAAAVSRRTTAAPLGVAPAERRRSRRSSTLPLLESHWRPTPARPRRPSVCARAALEVPHQRQAVVVPDGQCVVAAGAEGQRADLPLRRRGVEQRLLCGAVERRGDDVVAAPQLLRSALEHHHAGVVQTQHHVRGDAALGTLQRGDASLAPATRQHLGGAAITALERPHEDGVVFGNARDAVAGEAQEGE
eukprot:scaffold6226_cov228-Pinguiococcus_pyrenoidosus.AAC.1